MYPFTKVKECPIIQPRLNKDGRVERVSAVDQFDGQEFMLGDNGFKRSDISAYFHADSEKLRQAILERMQEVKLPDGFAFDTPVGEIIDMIVPAYCKTSAQIREWMSTVKDQAFDKFVEKNFPNSESKSDDKISFVDTHEPKSE